MTVSYWSRFLLGCAGLIGATGIALGAAGSHVSGAELARLASMFCLIHAATMVGLIAASASNLIRPVLGLTVAATLCFGTLAFSGDLAILAFRGEHLVRGLAPIGGMALLVGWFGLFGLALVPPVRR